VFPTALSALDIALWDLEGKRLGVPVARLLGGPFRTRLRVYASHWLQGADTPEKAFAGAQEAVRRGFTAFKCRPFSFEGLRDNTAAEIRRAAALIEAAREGAGPDTDILIECRVPVAAHRGNAGRRVASVPSGLVRGADPVREREGDGGAA